LLLFQVVHFRVYARNPDSVSACAGSTSGSDFLKQEVGFVENDQPNALILIFLLISYNDYYMFRQVYAIIREHLGAF
jgi:hypothetical protein